MRAQYKQLHRNTIMVSRPRILTTQGIGRALARDPQARPGMTAEINAARSAVPEPPRPTSRRPRSAHHNLLVQFLIDDLDRAVDLGIGRAELMRDQFYQQVDR